MDNPYLHLEKLLNESQQWNVIFINSWFFLASDVPGLENRQAVENSQEKVNSALMEYCVNFYPHLKDKFGQVLLRLPEVRLISMHAEEFLYYKHLNGEIPDQTLLIEMLHSKKK